MYKFKFIFGQMVEYNGKRHKVQGIRFTAGGVLYKLTFINNWIPENDIQEIQRHR